jgi:hypothetical protein
MAVKVSNKALQQVLLQDAKNEKGGKYMSLHKYFIEHGRAVPVKKASFLGRFLTKEAQRLGIKLKRVKTTLWGEVNAYPVDFLEAHRELLFA